MDELPLFDLPAPARRPAWHALKVGVQRLADEGILLGTSSWKYPGWIGWLYDKGRYQTRGKLSMDRFERNCLKEYAEVFRTVCVDAGYYTFPAAATIAGLMDQVPPDFRFSWKATAEITMKRFPALPRYGRRGGQLNPAFLDAELFANCFLGPMEPYRERTGVIIFEFSRFQAGDWNRGVEFVEAMDAFLGKLPGGWQYGVEIRNRSFLEPPWFACLAKHGVAHVFNSWQHMPGIDEQLALPGSITTDFASARLLLKPGRAYADAVEMFSPYGAIKESLPSVRVSTVELIHRLRRNALPTRRSSYLYVNNRLEGNALETILAVISGSTA